MKSFSFINVQWGMATTCARRGNPKLEKQRASRTEMRMKCCTKANRMSHRWLICDFSLSVNFPACCSLAMLENLCVTASRVRSLLTKMSDTAKEKLKRLRWWRRSIFNFFFFKQKKTFPLSMSREEEEKSMKILSLSLVECIHSTENLKMLSTTQAEKPEKKEKSFGCVCLGGKSRSCSLKYLSYDDGGRERDEENSEFSSSLSSCRIGCCWTNCE